MTPDELIKTLMQSAAAISALAKELKKLDKFNQLYGDRELESILENSVVALKQIIDTNLELGRFLKDLCDWAVS